MFNLNKKASNWTLAFALAAGVGATGVSAPVFAEDETALEEVVVTGSRIRRTNADSATPLTVLGTAEIDGVGTTNLGQLMESLPQAIAASNQSNSTFSSTGGGFLTTALRNLGQSRTLTLIDGRRFVSGFSPGSGYAVDLSTIPVPMIERVEIITGGASAVYGSDAVAGVVNIIMKDDFEGVAVDLRSGISSEGDHEETDASITVGSNLDRGNAYMTFGYSKEGGIHARDREFSKQDLYEFDTDGDLISDTQGFLGSSFPPGGRCGPVECGTGAPFANGYNNIGPTSRFNRGSRRQLLIPIERKYARSGITYEISDDLQLDMNIGFNETTVSSDIEPVPLDLNTDIFNTDTVPGGTGGLDIATSLIPQVTKDALLAAGFTNVNQLGNSNTGRRLVEFGDRGFDASRTTMYGDGTLTYNIDDNWSVEAYATWGRTRSKTTTNGNFNVERARLALDVEVVNGVAQCADASARQAGCVPFTPWGEGSITPEQVEYLKMNTTFVSNVVQTVYGANLSGDTGFALPGGSIAVAGGIEHRREEGDESPSGGAQSGIISGNRILATDGEFDVTDLYVEALFPVHEKLSFEAAIRYGDYSSVGDLTTYKIGFDAPVLDYLKFRGTYADSVRAPNISDLYSGAGETFATVSDPCRGLTLTDTGTTAENCRSIPEILARMQADPNGEFVLTQTELQSTGGLVGGNPNVQEETAESFTLGVVFSAAGLTENRLLEGLTVGLDWYDIEIENAIATTSRTLVVSRCFADTNFDPTCGGRVLRSNGALVSVDSGSGNENNFYTAGMDIDVNYNVELADVSDSLRGNLNMSLLWNYLDEWDQESIESGSVTSLKGEILFPEHRWNLTTVYSIDDITVTWRMRYWDDVVDDLGGGFSLSITPTGSGFAAVNDVNTFNSVDSIFYHDLRMSLALSDTISLYMGANNVLDEQPPLLTQNSNYGATGINTAPEAYDVIGRQMYAGVNIQL